MRPAPYDPNSYDLAKHFLQEEPEDDERTDSLAMAIQSAVEDWFNVHGDQATDGPSEAGP